MNRIQIAILVVGGLMLLLSGMHLAIPLFLHGLPHPSGRNGDYVFGYEVGIIMHTAIALLCGAGLLVTAWQQRGRRDTR